MKAIVKDVYQMTLKKAAEKGLSTLGASHFNGSVIVEVKYPDGGLQSTRLLPSPTALSIKKGDEVEVTMDGQFIGAITFNHQKLKGGW